MNTNRYSSSEEPKMKDAARRRRRFAAIVVGAVAVAGLGLAGVAYAFWTTNGTGTGSAAPTSAIDLTVSVTDLTGVYPKQKTTTPVTVTNTNPFPVTLSSITLDSVVHTGTGCLDTDVALDAVSGVSGITYTISASLTKAGSGATAAATFNVPIAIADLANGCQGPGHSFALRFTAHGISG